MRSFTSPISHSPHTAIHSHRDTLRSSFSHTHTISLTHTVSLSFLCTRSLPRCLVLTHKVHLKTHRICLSHIHTEFLTQRLTESLSHSLTSHTHTHTCKHMHTLLPESHSHIFLFVSSLSHTHEESLTPTQNPSYTDSLSHTDSFSFTHTYNVTHIPRILV